MPLVNPLRELVLNLSSRQSEQRIQFIALVIRSARAFAILGLILFCLLFAGTSTAATLAGQPVRGGGTVEIKFSVAKYFQDLAAQAGNPRVETGRAVLAFPAGFDPSHTWPILIVTSTSDFSRTSLMDAEWYRAPAIAEGWVVLGATRRSGRASIPPSGGSACWLPRSKRSARNGRNQANGRSLLPDFPAARNGAGRWARCFPRPDLFGFAAFF